MDGRREVADDRRLVAATVPGPEKFQSRNPRARSQLLVRPRSARRTIDTCSFAQGQELYFLFLTVRSFLTDFTPETFHAVQEALALVLRSGTSPVRETTPALVLISILALCRRESFAISRLTWSVIASSFSSIAARFAGATT